MIKIALTRFNTTKVGYSLADSYLACWKTEPDDNCHPISGYMTGAMKLMKTQKDQPEAWSFGHWKSLKGIKHEKENWLSATAIGLEYRGKDLAAKAQALHDKADELGYAHAIFDTMTRKGEATISIMFPLNETVNEGQYARLAKVLMSELGVYLAADGNCAMTHLFHVHKDGKVETFDGVVIDPASKIKQTKNLYQSKDPNEFCVGGKRAIPQIAEPTFTSHEGLFEWTKTDIEVAIEDADAILARIGAKLD